MDETAVDLLRPLDLELRHLRLVLAIHTEGGVTRASERLHLSQSALSHQLRDVEERLGTSLYTRTARKLVLTAAGERVLAVAHQVLRDVRSLESAIRAESADGHGLIRLTTECSTLYHWLPPVLKRFRGGHPRVRIQIVAEATSHPIEALGKGEVDVALVTEDLDRSDVHVELLFEDELLLVTPTGHRLASRRHVRPSDLADETLILYSPPSASRFYARFFRGSSAPPREVLQVQLTEAMLSMIRAGLGVGVFARWAIQAELGEGDLRAVRLGPRGLHRKWMAATRARERRPAYLADFIACITAEAAPAANERCA